MKVFALYFLLFIVITQTAFAQSRPLRIAVAANAQFVIKALQVEFKKKTGVEAEIIVGSSGNLVAQIKNGAPFDIFMSADMEFADAVYKAGLAITKPKEYALGSLIVCSRGTDVNNWRALVTSTNNRKIAIANPRLAPYGKAAEQALRKYDLWQNVQPRLVFGESVSQVNNYIITGAVVLGFTTEALIHEYPGKEKLKWVRVDKNAYDIIRQGFLVLNYAKKGNYDNAMRFYDYILSAPAREIFKKFGYQVL